MIEFTDFQCPFCARHVLQTWPQIEKEFVAPGKLLYVVRDFPLESSHPRAVKAAEASHCAGDQGKYWEMHDLLFAHQRALADADLVSYARTAGADAEQFQACVNGGKHSARVRRDLTEGAKLGLRGTPTFILGKLEDGKTVSVIRTIRGAQSFAAFKTAIDDAYAKE